jgi:hypothetical protein
VGNLPVAVALGDFNHDGHLDLATANEGDNTVSVVLSRGDGIFLPAVALGVGSFPRSVAVGDFNQDGNPDLAAANSVDNTVSVMLNQGEGTFRPAVALAVGDYPVSLAVGDFNGDGHLDLATANGDDITVSVLLGQGDGGFHPAVPQLVGGQPYSLTVGDFNHDGRSDLATANRGDNTVSVLLGQGDGTFRPAATVAVGPDPRSVAAGDFNNDGRLDLVTANFGDDTASVLLNQGDGTFRPAITQPTGAPYSSFVVVGDFNHDGNLDLATGGDSAVSVSLGWGDGTFLAAGSLSAGWTSDAVAVGDFNHDGRLDVAAAHRSDSVVSLLLGRGDGTFPAVPQPLVTSPGDQTSDEGDVVSLQVSATNAAGFSATGLPPGLSINADGAIVGTIDPRAAGTYAVTLTAGRFSGGTATPVSFTWTVNDRTPPDLTSPGGQTSNEGDVVSLQVSATDADNFVATGLPAGLHIDDSGMISGIIDALVAGIYAVTVTAFDGSRAAAISFTWRVNHDSPAPPQSQSLSVGNSPDAVAVGDFNHDGHPDLATANYVNSTVSVLLNQGDGTFRPAAVVPVGIEPLALAMGDFNHDGNLDLAAANSTSDLAAANSPGTISVLLGQGDGTFLAAATLFVGSYPSSLAAGDFNNDGQLDLATANYIDRTVSVLLGQGDGGFLPAATLTVGGDPRAVAVGDFNSDGSLDLAATNFIDSTISVMLGRGDGTFLPATILSVGSFPAAVAVGDFNHDGHLDLATANEGGNTVSVVLGRGDGSFQPGATLTVGRSPQSVAAEDFNQDGHLDLATANSDDNTVSVLLGQGDGTFQSAVNLSVGIYPLALGVGDFNHDGNLDLAAANASEGTVSLLPGRGDGRFTTTPVAINNPGDQISNEGDVVFLRIFATAAYSFSATGLPPGLSFTRSGAPFETISGTIDPRAAGTYAVTVTVFGGGAAATTSFTWTVNDSTPPLLTSPGYQTGNGGDAVSLQVLATDADSFSATGLPPGLDIDDNGLISGTIDPLGAGAYLVTVTAFDGSAAASISFTWTVDAHNNTLATALALAFDPNLQAQVSATLFDPNQVALYQVQLSAGDEFTAQVNAYSTSNPLDSGLRLFDETGRQLAFNDNQDGLDPQLIFTAPAGGVYYLGVSSANDFSYDPFSTGSRSGGNSTGHYTLSLARSPAAENEADGSVLGRNDTVPTADVINGNAHVHGTIGSNDRDYFKLTVTTSGRLTATVTPADGTVLLPRLTLHGDSGQLLILSDAVDSSRASAQATQFLQPGTYYLAVSAVSAAGGRLGDESYVLDTAFDPALPPFHPLSEGAAFASKTAGVGDFNHDGNLDLAVADYGASSVSLLLGLGDGSFSLAAATLPVGFFPTSVAVGDFNGDGNLDLVTTNVGDQTLSVLLNRGDGTFLAAAPLFLGFYPQPVAVGDFNHDGNLDLVTAGYASVSGNTVLVYLGRGDGSFLPVASPSVSDGLGTVGDFNHDGNLDLAAPGHRYDATGASVSTVWVLLGQGDGTFLAAAPQGLAGEPVAVGDFNQDGGLDLVTLNGVDNTLSVLLNRGDGTFLAAAPLSLGYSPQSVKVEDVNHDRKLDLLAAGDATASVLLGRGDGAFLVGVPQDLAGGPLAAGDFNHDGNLDLVTINPDNSALTVVLGRGDGSFLAAAPSLPVGGIPVALGVGDFNHDGHLDLANVNARFDRFTTSYLGTVSVFLGRGDSTFLPAVSYAVGSQVAPGFQAAAVAIGDFNHDGNLDLATANGGDNTVSVLLGRGDGTFLAGATLPAAVGPGLLASVTVGDFNNDGNLDLVDNTGFVWLGRGDGTFRPGADSSFGVLTPTPAAVVVGDFNHDGNLDLASGSSFVPDGNPTTVFLGRGDGSFLSGDSPPLPAAITVSLVKGDFNHDGILDLVSFNNDNMPLAELGRGDGTFLPAPPEFGTNWVSLFVVEVGDFNHDGNLDLADNYGSMFLGQGDGTFGPAVRLPGGAGFSALAGGDFNGDGNLDLAVGDPVENTVSVFLGRGQAQFQTATPENGIAIRHIPFLQDLNGDGIPDSVILNSSGALLFRQGLPGAPNRFAPPVAINPTPARDVTLFQTAAGPAIAAVDAAGNTVSIYSWSAALGSFQRAAAFAAGNLPVRIAAADLNGDGLGDLVVASAFDDSVTIALQQAAGAFSTLTRPVGAAPADVTIADLDGQDGPDLVVSGQVSGDVSVLFNDPSHSFSQQARYRAAGGLFGIDTSLGGQTVQSQQQTVAVAADDFTGAGRPDLVAVNRGGRDFTLLPNQGQGRFTAPQPGDSYLTGERPGEVISHDLTGDGRPDVAILMGDLGQLWVYRNRGDGTFDPPTVIDAGNDPRGFSLAQVKGRLAMLVGNGYGDILTLLSDGRGGFAPDRQDLQNVPLAVGTVPGTGQQYAVVADQQRDRVSVFFRIPGTDQFDRPTPIDSQAQPLLAPGAVQLFTVPGDPHPYLVVANSLGNNVLVYHGQGDGQFGAPTAYAVGFNPVSVTVAEVTGSVPDLLVANQGSNDVSVLIGAIDPNTHLWTATPYQRLSSGGSGPLAVAVRDTGSPHGPDLLVTNGDGKVNLVPGIGSGGQGSGFFDVPDAHTIDVGSPIVQGLLNAATGQFDVVRADGGISTLTGDSFTPLFTPTAGNGVTALDEAGPLRVAGFEDGSVGVLSANGTLLASQPTGFSDQPSALEVLQNGRDLEVFVTERGKEVPVIVSFAFIPVVTELPMAAAVAQGTSLPGADLVLVATLLSGGLVERLPANTTQALPGEEVFVLFLPPPQIQGAEAVGDRGEGRRVEEVAGEAAPVAGEPIEVPGWKRLTLGVTEALQGRCQRQQMDDRLEDIQQALQEFFDQFKDLLTPPTAEPGGPEAAPAPAQGPETAPLRSAVPEHPPGHTAPNSTGEQADPAAVVGPEGDPFAGMELPSSPTTPQGWPRSSETGAGQTLEFEIGVAVCLVSAVLRAGQPTHARAACPRPSAGSCLRPRPPE